MPANTRFGDRSRLLICNVEFDLPLRHEGAMSGREAVAGGLR